MLGREAMVKAMTDVIAPGGVPITDPVAVDENVKAMLGEFGINPDDAFTIANMVMMAAVQAGEEPERTVVSAFVTGLAIGARMMRLPEAA